MPTNIEDQETGELLNEYARLVKKTNTDALRDLLRDALYVLKRSSTADERRDKVLEFVRRLSVCPEPPNTKQTYDDLWNYHARD